MKYNNLQDNQYDSLGYLLKYGPADMSKGQHVTDEFKQPGHITFSTESRYSNPKTPGGEWKKIGDKWHFYASPFNLQQNTIKSLQDYFSSQPDSVLHLPNENRKPISLFYYRGGY